MKKSNKETKEQGKKVQKAVNPSKGDKTSYKEGFEHDHWCLHFIGLLQFQPPWVYNGFFRK